MYHSELQQLGQVAFQKVAIANADAAGSTDTEILIWGWSHTVIHNASSTFMHSYSPVSQSHVLELWDCVRHAFGMKALDPSQLAAGSCALRLGLRRQMWPQLTGKARKVKRLPRAARSIAQLPRLLRHILRFSIILVEEFRKFLVRRLDFSVRPRQHTLACAKKLNRGKPTGTPK